VRCPSSTHTRGLVPASNVNWLAGLQADSAPLVALGRPRAGMGVGLVDMPPTFVVAHRGAVWLIGRLAACCYAIARRGVAEADERPQSRLALAGSVPAGVLSERMARRLRPKGYRLAAPPQTIRRQPAP